MPEKNEKCGVFLLRSFKILIDGDIRLALSPQRSTLIHRFGVKEHHFDPSNRIFNIKHKSDRAVLESGSFSGRWVNGLVRAGTAESLEPLLTDNDRARMPLLFCLKQTYLFAL